MSVALIITITLMELLLAVLLVSTGLQMVKARSFAKLLDEYEQNPKSRTLVQRWFFGWQFRLQRQITRASIRALSNTFVTLFYRIAGLFFLILSVGMVFAIVFQWTIFFR